VNATATPETANKTELAKLCGVTWRTYTQWERGEREANAAAVNQVRILLWLHRHHRLVLLHLLADFE
jgi:transcriptional regulator with XRE-family HTH domain